MKEQSLAERTKDLEPEEHITIYAKKLVDSKKLPLYFENGKGRDSLLQKEKNRLNQSLKEKDELTLLMKFKIRL